ncbi:MAG TPA: Ig-like domain-containing protein, partial [Acidothermaceae bacterium]
MRSRDGLMTVVAAIVGVLVFSSLTACERSVAIDTLDTVPSAPVSSAPPVSSAKPTPAPPAQVTIAPADGASAVAPDARVSVSVANGTLTDVTVHDPTGDTVVGELGQNAHSWDSTGSLAPATQYLVTATAVDATGTATERSTSFTTAAPANVLGVKIAPLEGEVVGVGMPIIVYFTAAVTDEAAVERALTVEASEPVVGSWHWYGNKEVHYRPMDYWPAGDQVTLHVNLKGVDAGKGVWGTADRTLNFTIGDSHVSTVNALTHK